MLNELLKLNLGDLVNAVALQKSQPKSKFPDISSLAVYLLRKSDENYVITDTKGYVLTKSDVDEVTLDFTRGRTLSEEKATDAINYIFDRSGYLRLFNSRIVDKLVTPIDSSAITQKNLVSNEQAGFNVINDKRIVHNFGINLYLKHVQLPTSIPLQTVVNNLHNPNWTQEQVDKFAVALGNDILNLAINGLESQSYTGDFYDLNLGWNKMLQNMDGVNTNTQGNVKVGGFLGTYLTPNKVNVSGCIGSNYTAANLIAAMKKVYNAMPILYRKNPDNVFLMSQSDIDLYVDARADTTGSNNNVYREQLLTTGNMPNFMGHRLVAMPYWPSINETHESDSNLYGSIVFCNLKNLDLVSDRKSYRQDVFYNPRNTQGPAFEYTYDLYLDFHAMAPESFVIGFNGAKASKPRLVTEAGMKNGHNYIPDSSGTITKSDAASGDKFYLVSDNKGAVIVKAAATMANASTLADALQVSGATKIPNNGQVTYASGTAFYVRVYHPTGLIAPSSQVAITITNV